MRPKVGFLKKLFRRPLEGDGRRPVDNVDALAAGAGTEKIDPIGGAPGTAPPGYVPGVDEGRPQH